MQATPIDQHLFPLWKFDENGVPLSHIDEGHDKIFLEQTP